MAIIRVSGHLGAGKTTICDRLAEALGYKNHYTGAVFRELAKVKGLSLEEFYKQMVDNPELEKEIDARQEQLMLTEDNLIVQGRVAPFLAYNPNFKKINIFFKVSPEEGARRQLNRPENKDRTIEEMARLSEERSGEERKRYWLLYGIYDYLDESCFDIIVDTTNLNPEEVFEYLLAEIKKRH